MDNSIELISDLYSMYLRLDKNISTEKKIEILYLLIKLYDDECIKLSDKILHNAKETIEDIFNDFENYCKRDDIIPINLCIKTLEYIKEEKSFKYLTEKFIKNINSKWNLFDKNENIINNIFDIAYICEKNKIISFREDFFRLFVNILLELNKKYEQKIENFIKIAKYLKDIDMYKESINLMKSEIETLPIKLFVKYFRKICKLLNELELFTDEYIEILIENIRKNISKNYQDDILIHIILVFYKENRNEELIENLSKFNSLEKVLTFVFHNIKKDLVNLNGELKKEQKLKIIALFNKLYELYVVNFNYPLNYGFYCILSIHKILKTEDFPKLWKKLILSFNEISVINPKRFYEFLSTLE